MDLKPWLIIVATLLGPILAVQAQKAVEVFRDRRLRKMNIFSTLMATRAARLSIEHVQALNMIDIVFYGRRILGIMRRTKKEQAVLDAWKEYLDHLGTNIDNAGGVIQWNVQKDELFTNLLFAISKDVDYSFDRVQLKKGAYSPAAHGEFENDQAIARKLLMKALGGEIPIKMEIVNYPKQQGEQQA